MWALLLIGAGLVFLAASRKSVPTPTLKTGAVWVEGDDTKHLRALRQTTAMGKTPPKWLINEAMREAFDRGEWAIVAGLANATTPPTAEPSIETPPKEDIQIIIGKNSPVEGVSNDEWQTFVGKLKTQSEAFKNERHIGAYHHNRERLGELGIDPETLADETSQYSALEKDISSYNAQEQSLIKDFCGDVVTVKGTPHGITLSGVLGLLKAAGPKNARSWLRNDKERSEFPKTTEMFLLTNGLF